MSFGSVLIANRGEIAVRVIRACRRAGLRAIAVYSEADRGASYLQMADEAICIGPGPVGQSYLDGSVILMAAEATGAEAIHPGYGFLSENGDFAEAVARAGFTFIGPDARVIRLMGDKIVAKSAMREAGVPCVPGSSGRLPGDPKERAVIAAAVGYPVIVKAAGGGGGRGMRVVMRAEDLQSAIATTQAEAGRTFGNPEVYIEKYLERPRHVEIQVLCDNYGGAVWLGERDCSVQRRHQKLIEEAPAPHLAREEIAALGERCVEACRAIGYRGVGTFEFLYENGVFAFIEMNTRIQVEHPVTESITGVDLVYEQLRVAQGYPLSLTQKDIVFSGHSIECRINAENPADSSPCPGTVTTVLAPSGPGVRFDTHLGAGTVVPPYYDSLVGKLIVHGKTRSEALTRMQNALNELLIKGVQHNAQLHKEILKDADFMHGGVSIHFFEQWLTRSRAEHTRAAEAEDRSITKTGLSADAFGANG